MSSRYMDAWQRSALGRWYYGRENSEQKIIFGLTLLVLVSLLWVMLWKPVSDWRSEAAARQQRAQQLVDWLKANELAAKQSAQVRPQRAGASRTRQVTTAAQAHQININRLQPESNGVISVVLEQQPFNKIIAWVNQLEEGNGINVDRASVDGLEVPGYVNAQLRLN